MHKFCYCKALGHYLWSEARVAAANKHSWRCSVKALCLPQGSRRTGNRSQLTYGQALSEEPSESKVAYVLQLTVKHLLQLVVRVPYASFTSSSMTVYRQQSTKLQVKHKTVARQSCHFKNLFSCCRHTTTLGG